MEVMLSRESVVGPPYANTVKSPQRAQEPFSLQALQVVEKQNDLAAGGEDSLKGILERTVYLMEAYDRSVKYELIEEAGVYQIQVIDMSDGRVVRKVPPDEVLKIVEHLKEQLDDHVDVFA